MAELGAGRCSPKLWTCNVCGGTLRIAPGQEQAGATSASKGIWCYASVLAGGHQLYPLAKISA